MEKTLRDRKAILDAMTCLIRLEIESEEEKIPRYLRLHWVDVEKYKVLVKVGLCDEVWVKEELKSYFTSYKIGFRQDNGNDTVTILFLDINL